MTNIRSGGEEVENLDVDDFNENNDDGGIKDLIFVTNNKIN